MGLNDTLRRFNLIKNDIDIVHLFASGNKKPPIASQSPPSLTASGHRVPVLKPVPDQYTAIQIVFDGESSINLMSEKKFKGDTEYQIVNDPKYDSVLLTRSNGTSSLLYREIQIDMEDKPIYEWRWKAVDHPTGKKNERLGAKSDNDYSLRVYAMFKGSTIFTSEVIQYVWDDHFNPGSYESSPYSKNVKIFVLQKGPAKTEDGWVVEERNVYEDYKMLFGKEPKKPFSAIGIMSDSDNTKTSSSGFVHYLKVTTPTRKHPIKT